MAGDPRATAVKLLERRELTAAELRLKLVERGFDGAAIDTVLEEAAVQGWVDDRRVAETVAEMARRDGRGPDWLRQRLAGRGVDETLIDEVSAESDEAALDRARALVRDKFGDTDDNQRARAYRYLVRRGFPESQARMALGEDEVE